MKIFSAIFKTFLKFFLRCSEICLETTFSLYFYNLYKFIKIVFDTYLNFIKLSNISKTFWKASTKFQQVFCKIYTNFIHNLPKSLNFFF